MTHDLYLEIKHLAKNNPTLLTQMFFPLLPYEVRQDAVVTLLASEGVIADSVRDELLAFQVKTRNILTQCGRHSCLEFFFSDGVFVFTFRFFRM